jgi:isopentenyldiphosphate isomerase/phosphoglycolate phosphatase-like HAD superfamily hydrolase
MIKLVIIDFDDTLCLTEEATYNLESQIGIEMGFPKMLRHIHKQTWGRPIEKVITERIPGIDAGEFMKKLEITMPIFVERGELDNVLPKNIQILKALKLKGKTIAMLTSRNYSELKHIMHDDHALQDVISSYQYQNNSEYLKPDPRVFEVFFNKYKVQPHEVVYVGDTISDAICSNGAGIKFIACLESGLKSREDFATLNVDYFVEEFTQIEKVIAEIDVKDVNMQQAKVSNNYIKGNYNAASSDKSGEMLTEVTQDDLVIGPVSRKECHNETRKPWHRGTHVYLFDSHGNLYLSQRSYSKDTAPGQWTVSAGGHVKFGMSYEENVQSEINEELGLDTHPEMIDKLVIDYGSEREIIAIFAGVANEMPQINKEEVEQVKLFNYEEVISDFLNEKFDLSGGSRDSFRHVIESGSLSAFRNTIIHK